MDEIGVALPQSTRFLKQTLFIRGGNSSTF
jgi:hypothetical protein